MSSFPPPNSGAAPKKKAPTPSAQMPAPMPHPKMPGRPTSIGAMFAPKMGQPRPPGPGGGAFNWMQGQKRMMNGPPVASMPGAPGPGQPPPPGSAPGAPQAPTPMDDINKFYGQQLGEHDKNWQSQQGMLQGQMNSFGREADIINARMGGGAIDGGYAALAGGALGKGMEAYNKASFANTDRRNAMMADWAKAQINQRQRTEERGWAQEDRADDQRQRIVEMVFNATGEVPSEEAINAYLGGDAAGLNKMGSKGHVKTAAGKQVTEATYNNLVGQVPKELQDAAGRYVKDYMDRNNGKPPSKDTMKQWAAKQQGPQATVNYWNDYLTSHRF